MKTTDANNTPAPITCLTEWRRINTVPGTEGIFDAPLDEHLTRTNQSALPQAAILQDCVSSITHDGLHEAYLRGSFSSGEADALSDIDLFLVIDPENVGEIYDDVIDYLEDKYKIMVSCHDKLVKDYGGIGFMFICQSETGHAFQLDLYFAMKGVPPKVPLFNCPRIFSKDPGYCWLDEKEKQNGLPENAQAFIKEKTTQESLSDKADFIMSDAMVALFIMSKHLKRGQNARALNDNNHLMGLAADMLLATSGETTYHSSLYAFDKTVSETANNEDLPAERRRAAQEFDDLVLTPPSPEKIVRLFQSFKDIHTLACNGQSKIDRNLENFERHLISPLRQTAQPQVAPQQGRLVHG